MNEPTLRTLPPHEYERLRELYGDHPLPPPDRSVVFVVELDGRIVATACTLNTMLVGAMIVEDEFQGIGLSSVLANALETLFQPGEECLMVTESPKVKHLAETRGWIHVPGELNVKRF